MRDRPDRPVRSADRTDRTVASRLENPGMTRVLEFVVALVLVFILAVVVGLFLPSHGHIERSIDVSHNPRHIYDILNNFRRFPDYAGAVMSAEDPQVKFSLSGPAYGPGAKIQWTGNADLGSGSLTNESGNYDITGNSTITWKLDNDWRGTNKTFTFTVEPRNNQRISKVTWSYDVDYGWNLVDRYSELYLNGAPATLIQYSLNQLQNILASIPNVEYGKVPMRLVQTQAVPVLLVSTQAPRTLDDVDAATDDAMKQIHDAMDKLGVTAAGPRTVLTTEYGDQNYIFDVAVPINTTTVTIAGQDHDLTKLPPPPTEASEAAAASSTAPASGGTAAPSSGGSAAPSSGASTGGPASGSSAGGAPAPTPGSLDKKNQLIVSGNVRAAMLPGSEALEASWTGTPAGLPLLRLDLEAYAQTHGYKYDESTRRIYDQLVSLPNATYDEQSYRVFLPVSGAPAQTPGQAMGRVPPLTQLNPAAWNGSAPASGASSGSKPEAGKKPPAHKKKPAARKKKESRRHRHG
jgi:hypothetical protein